KKTVIAFLLASVISIGAVSYKNDYFEIAKQIEIFTTLFKELNMNYVDETIPAELMDKAIKGMLEGLDPYTVYYNEQDVEQAKINQTGSYSGIGAYIRNQENRLLVIEPWKDGPADKAGLKAGDEIIQIGDVKVANFNDDAGELLKGAPGSSVEVTYSRQGKTNKVTVTREAVEINAVPFYTLIEGNIGYIVLS